MRNIADTWTFDDEMLLYCMSPYIREDNVPDTFARVQHDIIQMKIMKDMQRERLREQHE